MEKFHTHRGKPVLLDQANVDTDQIIPKQFLKSIARTGYGKDLFFNWRYLADGKPNSHFALNRPEAAGASILLTRANFGCGSSREHAVWALQQYGFRAIIGEKTPTEPAFADIFRNNCLKNGLLLIALPAETFQEIAGPLRAHATLELSVELPSQTLLVRRGKEKKFYRFEIDPHEKEIYGKGLDEIAQTLQDYEGAIQAYEQKHL
jgi:3-isopropylmalate/(R)-2-methylmalate dehydratase small subunit